MTVEDRKYDGDGNTMYTPKYNLGKANWKLLKRQYTQQEQIAIEHLDDMAKAVTNKIRVAMDQRAMGTRNEQRGFKPTEKQNKGMKRAIEGKGTLPGDICGRMPLTRPY